MITKTLAIYTLFWYDLLTRIRKKYTCVFKFLFPSTPIKNPILNFYFRLLIYSLIDSSHPPPSQSEILYILFFFLIIPPLIYPTSNLIYPTSDLFHLRFILSAIPLKKINIKNKKKYILIKQSLSYSNLLSKKKNIYL